MEGWGNDFWRAGMEIPTHGNKTPFLHIHSGFLFPRSVCSHEWEFPPLYIHTYIFFLHKALKDGPNYHCF